MDIAQASMAIKEIGALDHNDKNFANSMHDVLKRHGFAGSERDKARLDFLKVVDDLASHGKGASLTRGMSMDQIKKFIANIGSSATRLFPDIAKLAKTLETEVAAAPVATTTANVGAYPVPLGQEAPGRKHKKDESVSRLMGLGAYIVESSSDVDEEMKKYL